MTLLLRDPDDEKTITNVRKYLDEEFPHLITKSRQSLTDLQSVAISDMPSAKGIRNSNEDKITGSLIAKETVRETVIAIKCCPAIYSEILSLLYLKGIEDSKIIERLPYEQSQYYKHKRKAMLWFADAFEEYYDLHVYKS